MQEIDPVLNAVHTPKQTAWLCAYDNVEQFPWLLFICSFSSSLWFTFLFFFLVIVFFFMWRSFFFVAPCLFLPSCARPLLCVRHFPYCYCCRFSSFFGIAIVMLALDVLKLLVFIVIVCFYSSLSKMVSTRAEFSIYIKRWTQATQTKKWKERKKKCPASFRQAKKNWI